MRNFFNSLSVGLSKTDEELMELVKKNNQLAFRKLFDKYQGLLMGFVYGFVKNKEIAEELVQKSFMKLYDHRQSFDSSKKFKTWLWTIAKNNALDHIKKKKEQLLEDYLRPDQSGDFDIVGSIEDVNYNLINMILEKETKQYILNLLDKLPLDQREAIYLKFASDMSLKEIGEVMNKSEGAVKSLIFRGKKSLEKIIGESKNE